MFNREIHAIWITNNVGIYNVLLIELGEHFLQFQFHHVIALGIGMNAIVGEILVHRLAIKGHRREIVEIVHSLAVSGGIVLDAYVQTLDFADDILHRRVPAEHVAG